MAHELWLRVPRNRVVERGFGVTQTPGDVEPDLTGTFSIDPLTGFATAPVELSWQGALDWPVGGDLLDCKPFVQPDGTFADGVVHRSTDAFAYRSTTALSATSGFFLGFWCYGGGAAFEVWFGGLQLAFDRGQVGLRLGQVELAGERFWDEELWEQQAHFLYVYAIGQRLAVRGLGPERSRGLLVELGNPLPGGAVTVTGTGFLGWQIAPERHGTLCRVTHATIRMPEKATEEPSGVLQHVLPAGATATFDILDENGDDWPGAPDPPYAGFGWRAEATCAATGPNVYLTRARVAFPQKMASDGLTAVDLLALPNASVRSVEDRRALDADGCGLTFTVRALRGTLSPYIQPNMRGSWRPFGTQRADFYTTRPGLDLADPTTESITFEAESGWKRLKNTFFGAGGSYGGKLLSQAYYDAALRALDAAEIAVATGGYRLPAEDPDGRALFDFRPEETVAGVLQYLRDQFGAGDLLRFKPDGKLHCEPRPTAASGISFGWAGGGLDLEAIAHGTNIVPYVLGDSWHESFDESGFANEVWVVGQDRNGAPLVAVATDWESVREPAAANYVGEFRRMVIIDAGLPTQALVNWVCRAVLERVRLLPLVASFRAIYVPSLLEGAIVGIEGRGDWRLTAMTTTWDNQGPQGIAAYEAEKL